MHSVTGGSLAVLAAARVLVHAGCRLPAVMSSKLCQLAAESGVLQGIPSGVVQLWQRAAAWGSWSVDSRSPLVHVLPLCLPRCEAVLHFSRT